MQYSQFNILYHIKNNSLMHDATMANLVYLPAKEKSKVLPYLFPSAGPGADPDVLAVSPQVTKPYTQLPLLSNKPAVTFPAEEHHCQ